MPEYTAYTDGSCLGNPGSGGWAVILLDSARKKGAWPQERSGSAPYTTNNRMELQAAIEAMTLVPKGSSIKIFTDSNYVKQGITTWIHGWKRNGWRTSNKSAVKNRDQWIELDSLRQQRKVEWQWVKGHASNKWNNRADELARYASSQASKLKDEQQSVEKSPPEPAMTAYLSTWCRGHAMPAGWGVVVAANTVGSAGEVKERWGCESLSSSNRVVLQAAINALEMVSEGSSLNVLTSSDYLVKGMTVWMPNWKRSGWRTKSGSAVKFKELWIALDELNRRRKVTWRHGKISPSNEGFEQAMALARLAIEQAEGGDSRAITGQAC